MQRGVRRCATRVLRCGVVLSRYEVPRGNSCAGELTFSFGRPGYGPSSQRWSGPILREIPSSASISKRRRRAGNLPAASVRRQPNGRMN